MPHHCEICDYTFDDGKTLKRHNTRLHPPQKRIQSKCNLCDYLYYTIEALEKHTLDIHRGKPTTGQKRQQKKTYECQVCGSPFSQNVSLQYHMKKYHQSITDHESSASDEESDGGNNSSDSDTNFTEPAVCPSIQDIDRHDVTDGTLMESQSVCKLSNQKEIEHGVNLAQPTKPLPIHTKPQTNTTCDIETLKMEVCDGDADLECDEAMVTPDNSDLNIETEVKCEVEHSDSTEDIEEEDLMSIYQDLNIKVNGDCNNRTTENNKTEDLDLGFDTRQNVGNDSKCHIVIKCEQNNINEMYTKNICQQNNSQTERLGSKPKEEHVCTDTPGECLVCKQSYNNIHRHIAEDNHGELIIHYHIQKPPRSCQPCELSSNDLDVLNTHMTEKQADIKHSYIPLTRCDTQDKMPPYVHPHTHQALQAQTSSVQMISATVAPEQQEITECEELKKNSDAVKKAKKRHNNMTPTDYENQREKTRMKAKERRKNMTSEEREKRRIQERERRKNRTTEEREKRSIQERERCKNMTSAQREKRRVQQQERCKNTTSDQREKRRIRDQERCKNRTSEEREKRSIQERERCKNMTSAQREKRSIRDRERRKNRTSEEREKHRVQERERRKNRTREEREKRSIQERERRKNMTSAQCEKRHVQERERCRNMPSTQLEIELRKDREQQQSIMDDQEQGHTRQENEKDPSTSSGQLHVNDSLPDTQPTIHDESDIFACSACQFKTLQLNHLLSHFTMEHKELNLITTICKVCGFHTNNSTELETHIATYSHDKCFTCEQCSATFLQPYKLTQHIRYSHESTKVLCPYCGCKYKSLTSHIACKHTTGTPCLCNECGEQFATQRKLNLHIQNAHIGPLSCTLCDYTCKVPSTFQLHMDKHLGIKPRFTCEICGVGRDALYLLREHMLTHNDIKSFKCTLCDYRTNIKYNIREHINRTHHNLKRHACDLCDYKTYDKANLFTHQQHKHNIGDVKMYKCTEAACDYVTKWYNSFKCHKLKNHGDGIPNKFNCSHCEFNCCSKNGLRNHIRTHTGEKPFECPHCGFRCNVISNLRSHIKTHAKADDKTYTKAE